MIPRALHHSQVQALAGAMLSLGTLNGAQCAELLRNIDEGKQMGELQLLSFVRQWPLLYGCVWGLLRPASERSVSKLHPRACEPWVDKPDHERAQVAVVVEI